MEVKKLLSVLVSSQIQCHELLIRLFESSLLDVFFYRVCPVYHYSSSLLL